MEQKDNDKLERLFEEEERELAEAKKRCDRTIEQALDFLKRQSEKDKKPSKSLLDMIKKHDEEMNEKNLKSLEEMDRLAREIIDGLEKLKNDLKPNDK